MISKWKNRLLSMFLVFTLCLSMTSTSTLAVEAAGQSTAAGHEKITISDNGEDENSDVSAGNGENENDDISTGNGENENSDVSAGNGENENNDVSTGNGEDENNDISSGNSETTYAAENTTTGKKYPSLNEALNEAQDGETVILLADNQVMNSAAYVVSDEGGKIKTITLDLNGKTCNGSGVSGGICVGRGLAPAPDYTRDADTILKIVGTGNIIQSYISGTNVPYTSIGIYPGSTLDFSGWKGGEISHVEVYGNRHTYKNGAITGDIPENGKIEMLTFTGTQSNLNVALNGGSYGTILAQSGQDVYAKDILASGYAFRNADGTFVSYEVKIAGNGIKDVTVVKCNHEYTNKDEVFTNGTCNACGYVCPHEDANVVDGACTVCGTIFAAQNINTGARYQSLNEALYDAADDQTLKVLADNKLTNSVYILNKTITLDLNGKTCDGDGFIIRLGNLDTDETATLKLTGTGNLKQPNNCIYASFSIFNGGTLDLTGWKGGEIASLSVYPKAKIQTKDMSGTIGEVCLNGIPDGGGIALDGGSYGVIYLVINGSSGGSMKAGSLLAAGYTFKNQDGTMVPYNRTLTHGIDVGLTNVTVVKCTAHQDKDKDGHCDGCNAGPLVAGVNDEYYYTSLSDAWDAAVEMNNGSTVKLIKEITEEDQSEFANTLKTDGGEIVLDLNGFNLLYTSFNTKGKLVLKNSSATAVTVAGVELLDKPDGNGGRLDIRNDNITVDRLNVSGSGAELTCGTFNWINISTPGVVLINLVADGYAFADAATGVLVNNSLPQVGTTVKIIEHTHRFQGSAPCTCGYTCEHEVDANGKCTKCQTQYEAKVVTADGTVNYYAAENNSGGNSCSGLYWAMNDAPDGSTVYPLKEQSAQAYLDGADSSRTLDLNGITLDGGNGIYVTDYGKQKLTLTGEGIINATVYVRGGGVLRTKDFQGKIGILWMYSGSTVGLNGGTYGKILRFGDSCTAGDILAEGYAFRAENGSFIQYDKQITLDDTLINVTVVKCDEHDDSNSDGKCDYCNGLLVAAVTAGSEIRYFIAEKEGFSVMAIPSAVAYANENGGTIRPLADGIAIYNANCAIDLNGKNVAYITAAGSDLTVTGEGTVKNLNAGSGSVKLYGGYYEDITTFVGSNKITLGDLLPDGYGFQKADKTWLTEEELAKSGFRLLQIGTDAIGTVMVKQAPVTELTLTAPDITYTEDLTVTAKTGTTGGAAVTYKWYLDGEELRNKTEATLVLSDEVYENAGTYTIKCVVSCGTYVTGKEVTVTVNPVDIKDAYLAIIGEENLIYHPASNDKDSGTELNVAYNLWYKDKVLSENDHTVTGNKNVRLAGSYTLTVTGKGNYTGTKSIDFEVKPCVMLNVFPENLEKTYDGTKDIPLTLLNQLSFMPDAYGSLTIGLERGVDYEIVNAQYDSAEVGVGKTVVLKVRMLNKNFFFEGGEREKEFVIPRSAANGEQSIIKATINPQPAELEVANNRAKTYKVDLTKLLPELTAPQEYGQITYGLPVVSMKTDYYVVGGAKIEKGVLSLPIEKVKTDEEGNIGNVHIVVSTANYEDMVLEINVKATNKKETVSVSKQTPRVTELPVAAAQTYNPSKTLRDVALTGGKVLDANGNQIAGTWRWQNTQIVPLVGNKGYTAIFTPGDSAAYEQVSSTIIVNIGKATPVIAIKPTAAAITYGKNLGASALSGGAAVYSEPDGMLISGTFRWLHEDTVPTATADYTVIFTPTDTANYETVQTEVKVTVQNAPTTPDKPNTPDKTIDVPDETEDNNKVPEDNNEVPEDNKQDNGKNDGQNKDQNQENGNNTGEPFIKDDSSKSGWELIKDEMKDTKDGGTVVVDMNGATNVPSDIFEYLKGKDMKVQFDMGDGIVWTVSGKDVTDIKGDINLGVTFGSEAGKTIPVDVINTITQENYSMNLTLAYNGEFGFTATLTVNLKAENAGYYANLFYYNADSGELEFVCADRIDEEGNVNLTFTHASDYTIVLTDSVMNGTESPKASDNGVVRTKMWILLLGCAVVIVGLGIFFIIGRKKTNKRTE